MGMIDQNVTLRMLYLTVVIIALFVTLGVISALHEHGLQNVPYPFRSSNNHSSRRRRDILKSSLQLNVTGPKHYRLPKDDILDNLTNLALTKIFWFYVNRVQISCKNITSLPSQGDGVKICQDKLKLSKNKCLMYSIADVLNFEFESNVKKEYNCEVHAILSPRFKQKEKEQTDNGPADKNDMKFPEGVTKHHIKFTEEEFDNDKWKRNKMFNLIRRAFPKQNEIIDVVRMDLNGEEWRIIPKLIDSGLLKQVKHLIIEIHFSSGGVPLSENLKVLRLLYGEGFRLLSCKHKMTRDSLQSVHNMTITKINVLTFFKFEAQT